MNIIKHNFKFRNELTKRGYTRRIFLHHADAKNCTAEQIHNWHLANGWSGIGYHFLVRKDGSIHEGRPLDVLGAHCLNNNSDSIGICFEGNYEIEKDMPNAQYQSGVELVKYLMKKYNLTNKSIYGHKDAMSTDCPGRYFPLTNFKKITLDEEVKTEVAENVTKKKAKYSGQFPTLKGKECLGNGDKGLNVKYLQTFLNWYGNFKLEIDGDFGYKTEAAVKTFQTQEKLASVDGLFGVKSLKKAKKVKR